MSYIFSVHSSFNRDKRTAKPKAHFHLAGSIIWCHGAQSGQSVDVHMTLRACECVRLASKAIAVERLKQDVRASTGLCILVQPCML